MAQSKQAMYENILSRIIEQEGNVHSFLDVVFGFLNSKTDFFVEQTDKQSRYGFPPGVAMTMVQQVFDKHKKNRQRGSAELQRINEGKDKPVSQKKTTIPKKPVEQKVLTTQEEFQANADSFNGAVRKNYSWSQNYDEVDVKVNLPPTIRKSKQVKVEIGRKHLLVEVEGEGRSVKLIDCDLQHEIRHNGDSTTWCMDAGKSLDISLEKVKNTWWTALLTEEEEIDVKKIQAERKMESMPEEEQRVVSKLQFDEHQKRLGLPQSHEIKVHEMLKKGWNAEGSPFKGTEFDPKNFNISKSAVDM